MKHPGLSECLSPTFIAPANGPQVVIIVDPSFMGVAPQQAYGVVPNGHPINHPYSIDGLYFANLHAPMTALAQYAWTSAPQKAPRINARVAVVPGYAESPILIRDLYV
jgi:hypothetical protein